MADRPAAELRETWILLLEGAMRAGVDPREAILGFFDNVDLTALLDRLTRADQALADIRSYAYQCEVLRVEPTTAGLRAALRASQEDDRG